METKQVIVIRKDLKMRRGKEIAQGSHASMAFLTNKLRQPDNTRVQNFGYIHLSDVERAWLDTSFVKVCVRVDSEEELFAVARKARELGVHVEMIQDAGRTEFKEPTYTACAIGPDYNDRVDAVTGGLQLY